MNVNEMNCSTVFRLFELTSTQLAARRDTILYDHFMHNFSLSFPKFFPAFPLSS